MNKKQDGFTGIELLIFAAIISAGFGGIAWIFKDAIGEQFKKAPVEEVKVEEAKSVANPFPVKPSEEKAELPKEPVGTDVRIGGTPIVQPPQPVVAPVTAAGEWHGQYSVTAPEQCKGESGGWQATLTETGGVIRGNFSTDSGLSGSVGGSSSGSNVSWGVGGGGAGVNFKGAISGNTMSGTFLGLICDKSKSEENPAGTRSSGTYFGGRFIR